MVTGLDSSTLPMISVARTQAVINSTITPNMTFTKTSQKFGQWSDIRANTVYGLGFASEPELNKVVFMSVTNNLLIAKYQFIEKFQEVKEATRSAAQQKGQYQNGTVINANQSTNNRDIQNSDLTNDDMLVRGSNPQLCSEPSLSVTLPLHSNEHKGSLVAHQRSQSLSGLQANKVRAHCLSNDHSNLNVLGLLCVDSSIVGHRAPQILPKGQTVVRIDITAPLVD